MGWHEYVGYVGSVLMFSTFWMKTMIPLRIAGITANLAMVVYAGLAGMWPVLGLQVLMLPVNVYRIVQLRRLILHVAETAGGEFQPDALVPFMKKERHADGDVLFRFGDESDKMYLIRTGKVELVEVGRTLGPGDILGEIGIVSPHNRRTATAVCRGDARLMSITMEQTVQLYYQNPEFGYFLIRLVTQRLLHNLEAATIPAAGPASGGGDLPTGL